MNDAITTQLMPYAPSLEQMLFGAVFIGLRVGGLFVFAPLIGTNAVPMPAKAGLVVALVVLLAPVVPAPTIALTQSNWIAIVASELITGVLVGLCVSFIFDAVQFAGQILGIQMGFSLVTVFDPQTQADSPVLGLFFQMIVVLIFFAIDVHHWLIRAVVQSFYYLPAGSTIPTTPRASALMHTAGAIWVLGLQIAAPALIATIIADFALAFTGKASPQLPVMFVGLSIKAVLGMLAVMATLAAWPRFFSLQFAHAVSWSEMILRLK